MKSCYVFIVNFRCKMFIEIAPYWNKISFPKPFCNLHFQLKHVNRSIFVFSSRLRAESKCHELMVSCSLPGWARTKGFGLENCRVLLNRLALLYKHIIVLIGWVPFSALNLSIISDCWLFTVLKTLTGYRSANHSEYLKCCRWVPVNCYLLPSVPFFVIFISEFEF